MDSPGLGMVMSTVMCLESDGGAWPIDPARSGSIGLRGLLAGRLLGGLLASDLLRDLLAGRLLGGLLAGRLLLRGHGDGSR